MNPGRYKIPSRRPTTSGTPPDPCSGSGGPSGHHFRGGGRGKFSGRLGSRKASARRRAAATAALVLTHPEAE